ncbi:uncharacterized protein V6R79_005006 [Siganus canaliculatus]
MAASLVFRLHDRGPEVVRQVLLERGWEEYDEERREKEDWNLYWRGSAFHTSDYLNLLPWQRLNHHPKTAGITRKDCLARNLRRMRAAFGSALYDFSPAAFILPNDYTRFLAEYKKQEAKPLYWICKPVDQSRGRGIFIFQDLKGLVYDGPVIVQRYIADPLLVSGYKFDLRIYVCVKSFHPLTAYIHQEGLVRFATEKYDLSSLSNLFAHLTNTSINKLGPFYESKKERVGPGCKWSLSRFRHFLRSQDVDQLLLWFRISSIVTLTLLTIAPSVPDCPNCVELFGFDVLIDVKFRPWLLEVNYSPALSLDCQADLTVKEALVNDLIDVMSYTLTDGLRKEAYQRPSHVTLKTKPAPAGKQRTFKQVSKTQTLHQSPSRKHSVVSDRQRRLPPVNVNKTYAARGRVISRDRTLNLILGSHSRPNASLASRHMCPALAPWPMDDRSPHGSEVTRRDLAETEAVSGETDDATTSIHDPPKGDPGFRRPATSWKLPDIHSENHRPVKVPPDGNHFPPLRVGGFIRTFPFNAATLRSSQSDLDVKTIIQELHKMAARLGGLEEKQEEDVTRKKRSKRHSDDEEGHFESLLWGPTDPPLFSQLFKAT